MTTAPRLLVVGGRGFIGRHVVARARRDGWTVTSLSRRAVEAPGADAAELTVDATDAVALRAALAAAPGGARFDYVVNCGGYIDHRPFSNGGRAVFAAHFDVVLHLLDAIDRAALRGFVNVGSSDEYGNAPAPQHEGLREAPIAPYSLGKMAATQLLQMLHRTEGLPASTVRLFLAYGPGQDRARFLPQIIAGCLADQEFPTSAGEQQRDFCYIDDVVEGIVAALVTPAAAGGVFNIASGRAVTIRTIIERVRAIVGRGRPTFGAIAYRPGENMALVADVSRAREVLGWTPQVSLEDGLARTIAWVAGAAR